MTAFATAEDVARRRRTTFTDDDTATATMLVEAATAAIADAADKDDAWIDALNPVPRMLHFLCIEVAARSMANPDSARSTSEQLGAYQHSSSFRDDGGGLLLTTVEQLLVRRIVHGRTTGSSQALSVVDTLLDCAGS